MSRIGWHTMVGLKLLNSGPQVRCSHPIQSDMTTHRHLIVRALLFVLVLLTWSTASAECIRGNLNVRAAFLVSDLVFSGIVTKVDFDDRLGFQVDRVWKGPVSREMWIHQLDTPFIDSYVFRPRPDVKYIIFANELSVADRKFRVKADAPPAFGIHASCGDGPLWSLQRVRELDRIVKGKKPQKVSTRIDVRRTPFSGVQSIA